MGYCGVESVSHGSGETAIECAETSTYLVGHNQIFAPGLGSSQGQKS
jgi:hypothetical protein